MLFNQSSIDLIEFKIGDNLNDNPHHDDKHPYLTSIFTFAYFLVTILSLIGNSLILIVLLRRKRMRTVTNFFLANITIANLLYTVCAPLHFLVTSHGHWILADAMCTLLPFLSTLSINVNTFTMIAASIERFVVIVYPFLAKLTKNKCIASIGVIWVLATLFSVPWLFLLKVNPVVLTKSFDKLNKMQKLEQLKQLETFKSSIMSSLNISSMSDPVDFLLENVSGESFLLNETSFEMDLADEGSLLLNYELDIMSNLKSPTHHQQFHTVKRCEERPNLDLLLRYYFFFLCITQYFMPLTVLILTYTIIAYYVYVINHKVDSNIIRNNSTTSSCGGGNKSYRNILGKNKKKVSSKVSTVYYFLLKIET